MLQESRGFPMEDAPTTPSLRLLVRPGVLALSPLADEALQPWAPSRFGPQRAASANSILLAVGLAASDGQKADLEKHRWIHSRKSPTMRFGKEFFPSLVHGQKLSNWPPS